MTFFFDNDLSHKLPYVLRILGVNAVHLKSYFGRDAKDREWLPEVGRRGWVVVTKEKRMWTRPAERTLLRRYRITCVCLKGLRRKGFWDQARWLLARWQRIRSDLEDCRQGTWLDVPERAPPKRYS